jgi:hypothetical protein
MIFNLNIEFYEIKRKKGTRLSSIGCKEIDFQKVIKTHQSLGD